MAKPGRKKGTPKTGGRARGVQNKITRELKDMILGALDRAGGEKYLWTQASENPAAFMGLLGKLLPKDLHLSGGLTLEQMVAAAGKRAAEQAQ